MPSDDEYWTDDSDWDVAYWLGLANSEAWESWVHSDWFEVVEEHDAVFVPAEYDGGSCDVVAFLEPVWWRPKRGRRGGVPSGGAKPQKVGMRLVIAEMLWDDPGGNWVYIKIRAIFGHGVREYMNSLRQHGDGSTKRKRSI